MENFSGWLTEKLRDRGWKQADLARASNLDSAVISNLINGKRGPGQSTCEAIARALDIPPETVFRAAGLLPDLPTPRDYYEEIIIYRLSKLSDTQLEDVFKYIDFISTREQKPLKIK